MPASPPFTFGYTGQIVTFTVPQTGLYDILTFGAQGGGGGFSGAGGLAADLGGAFQLTAGQVLSIALSGAGKIDKDAISGGDGGGGSFVVLNGQAGSPGTALAVAAGGGLGSPGGNGQTGTGAAMPSAAARSTAPTC